MGSRNCFVTKIDPLDYAMSHKSNAGRLFATALTQSAPARLLRSNHLDDSAGRDALLGTPGYHRGAPFSGSAQTGARSKIIQLSEIFPNRAGLSIF